MKKYLLALLTLTFCYTTSLNYQHISAAEGDILLEEHFDEFENSIPDNWTLVDTDGSGVANGFTITNGMLGNIVNQVAVGEIVSGDTSWTNYKYEFDLISYNGDDRNIIFRWQDQEHRLGLHITGGTLRLEKLIPAEEKGGPLNPYSPPVVNVSGKIPHNMNHHFTITLDDRNIRVHLKNDLVDEVIYNYTDANANAITSGAIGFRVGAGSVVPSSVWIDNVIVTDLSEDEAEGLSVPHFSQLDTEWKDKEYDTASLINPVGSQEIEDWGCALTSAAMILKYHGYDTTPDGELLTPETLNEYLKLNNGYNQVGGVVWSSITSFAIDAATHSAYLNQNLPKLEFQYPEYDLDQLTSDIELSNPAILKIITDDQGTPYESDDATHFVVAKGIQNDQILINDPLDLQETDVTLSERYSDKVIKQMGRFIPSNTDLSYIWLYNYDPQVNLVVEYQGKKTGIGSDGTVYNQIPGARYFEDSIIGLPPTFDLKFGGADTYVQVFMLPKPESGNYKITYSSNSNLLLNNDLHLFDTQSRNEHFKVVSPLTTSSSVSYLLTFDKSNSDLSTLVKVSDYQSLRAAIHYSESQNWLSSNLADRLLNLVTRAEKGRVSRVSRVYLSRIDYLLDLNKNSELTIEAYQLIKPELDAVLASL